MSDLVAALHAELAAIHGVKPGHSLTGDYAALKGDAERLAAAVVQALATTTRLTRHYYAGKDTSHPCKNTTAGDGLCDCDDTCECGAVVEDWLVHYRDVAAIEVSTQLAVKDQRIRELDTALARAHELAQEEA